MKFTVDRTRWARQDNEGPYMGEPALLNEQGNMCCLGFCAYQMNVSKDDLSEL